MRIAHFIQRYPPVLGGAEAYFARLSRFHAEQGDDVTIFTTDAQSLEALWSPTASHVASGVTREDGVCVRRYPLWRMRGRRWLLKPLSLIPNRLWQCLTLPCNPISLAMWQDAGAFPTRFDAVHASAFPYAFPIVCARRLARSQAIPFFLTPFLHLGDPTDPHDPIRRAYSIPALRWLLREADGVFVQTPSERAAALASGVAESRVTLQGLGVSPTDCVGGDRSLARKRWNLPVGALVIGHLANLSWEKGTNDLLQAAESLWANGTPVHLLLAGPMMPNFERAWRSLQQRQPDAVRRFVRVVGPLSEEEKRDFFAGIDVFALPSRCDSFGLVLLEAWANGVPNVAYRAGGVADVIRHDRDGLFVPCGDIASFANALRQLHDDSRRRMQLGSAGRERLATDFVWQEKLNLVRETIGSVSGAFRPCGRISAREVLHGVERK
ncbi:MAG: glycosyltransferase family 1 protein [Gemmataceae bacterium]|nr:glycosyltransferase family 1 protein [Gemmataceae bacterium]